MNRELQPEEPMPSRAMLYLTIPIVATSILLLAVGAAAAWYVHQLNREVSHLLADNLECAVACQDLVSAIHDARTELHRFMDTGDETHLETVAAARSHTILALDNAERSAPNDQVRELLLQARKSHDQFFAEITVLTSSAPGDAVHPQMRAISTRLDSELLAPAEQIIAYNRQVLLRHSDRSRDVADRVGLGLFALGACGAVAGLLSGFGVARSLTERLEQREREALRAEQLAAVGQLAAGLAHELRNPLTSMKILIQTAEEQGESAALVGRDLNVLREEVERLEHLVNSFLDFARPPELEKTTFDVRGLIDQTLHLVSGPARQHNVAIDYHSPRRPLDLEADPVQIRQVLLNLLLNSLDAMPEGGTVRVLADLEDEASAQQLVIRVVDTGPGIPSELRDRVFEPFVSSKETGTGLGLAICRRIAEAHGGTIEVENGEGGGAEFALRLPLPPEAEKPGDPTQDLLEREAQPQ